MRGQGANGRMMCRRSVLALPSLPKKQSEDASLTLPYRRPILIAMKDILFGARTLVHRVISRRHTVGFKRVWMRGVSEEHIRCDT